MELTEMDHKESEYWKERVAYLTRRFAEPQNAPLAPSDTVLVIQIERRLNEAQERKERALA